MTEKKFYQLSIDERLALLAQQQPLSETDLAALSGRAGLTEEKADHMVENVIGTYALPIGIAQNFIINGKEVAVPMVIEEPSVIAAASNGAKIVARSGGFQASADQPEMIGQLQIIGVPDLDTAADAILAHKEDFLQMVAEVDPMLSKLGGGARDLQVRKLYETERGPMLVLHLIMDVRDAMGANAINTALEKIAPRAAQISGGEVRLRILSNLADHRLARSSCRIAPQYLALAPYSGEEVRERILDAAAFAEADPYRAVTHNKGVMNGIDAMTLACGNDWRAIEAGAHAWASRNGAIRPLTHWHSDTDGNLCGEIELPLALGMVGGATRVHPGAAAAVRLMGVKSSQEMAQIAASLGLAQNLAALRALATEGIQKGHMVLHARQLAMAAGASATQADAIAARMIKDGKINAAYAEEIVRNDKTANS